LSRTAAQIQRWLRVCEIEHKGNCAEPVLAPVLPTRIIDVGSIENPVIVLCEPQGAMATYVCLSYCWGGAEFYKTTAQNIEDNKMQISAEDLPLAFNLAIQLVRILGIRYIWIDALCIIQDDDDDWKNEASKMADIYTNCFMTISLTALSNPFEEFKPKDEREQILNSVEAYVRHHFPVPTPNGNGPSFPLLSRAWAFQERVLSPKVVHLGRHELVWGCQQGLTCECCFAMVQNSHRSKYHALIKGGKSISPDLEVDVKDVWRSIVKEYSARMLSVPSDKLPALAGIAESMRRMRKDEYLAGLWSSTLASDLCWVRSWVDPQEPTRKSKSQDSMWRAPSWTWACAGGRVYFANCLNVSCTVLDYHVIQDGPSLTGKVKSGCIILRTVSMSCSIFEQ
jgi:hypothetical protein